MHRISRFVIWICSKFTKAEIEFLVKELSDILNNRNPEVKPKDDFKEKHPNYRNFYSDPKPPLTSPPKKKLFQSTKNYLHLTRKNTNIPYHLLISEILKTPPRKILFAIPAVLHINIYISIMEKSVLNLNVRSVIQYHLYTNVIFSIQNISVLTAVIPCFSGNNEKIVPSINAITITALFISQRNRNLTLLNECFGKLNPLSLSCIINSANTISPINNLPTLRPNPVSISPISEIHSILFL